eukprot:GHVU01085504.1.p1 GENE.GHVU01085504.1~~GHVU01085504.1.p1  ORF type:complete len:443 (+),score=91.52 GHVU01085504.1:302-1630(+)
MMESRLSSESEGPACEGPLTGKLPRRRRSMVVDDDDDDRVPPSSLAHRPPPPPNPPAAAAAAVPDPRFHAVPPAATMMTTLHPIPQFHSSGLSPPRNPHSLGGKSPPRSLLRPARPSSPSAPLPPQPPPDPAAAPFPLAAAAAASQSRTQTTTTTSTTSRPIGPPAAQIPVVVKVKVEGPSRPPPAAAHHPPIAALHRPASSGRLPDHHRHPDHRLAAPSLPGGPRCIMSPQQRMDVALQLAQLLHRESSPGGDTGPPHPPFPQAAAKPAAPAAPVPLAVALHPQLGTPAWLRMQQGLPVGVRQQQQHAAWRQFPPQPVSNEPMTNCCSCYGPVASPVSYAAAPPPAAPPGIGAASPTRSGSGSPDNLRLAAEGGGLAAALGETIDPSSPGNGPPVEQLFHQARLQWGSRQLQKRVCLGGAPAVVEVMDGIGDRLPRLMVSE